MKKIIYIFVICNLQFAICNLNAQWVFQNSGTTQHLYDIFFIDKNTGWACGNNSTILKTTNGGVNWFEQNAGNIGLRRFNCVYFIDINIGYIAGVYKTLLKTIDGGNNWNIICLGSENQGNSLWDISFINENTGWISGEVGAVFRTTNGGLDWDSLNSGSIGILYNIEFLNENTGYVCPSYIRKTTDGGNNWQVQIIGTFATLSMDFINTETGWCVGEQDNKVFKTTNGGNNWDLVSTLTGGNLQYSYCVRFIDSLRGWIGGTYGRIYNTSDGGYNWINEDYDSLGFVNNFSFYKDTLGWCTGGGGKIKQKDIFIGIENISSEVPLDYILYQNYPNPFNPKTTIEFEIPKRGHVTLMIYSILGKVIEIIVDEVLSPGKYKTMFNGQNLSSGIYFYILSSDKTRISNKMILIK